MICTSVLKQLADPQQLIDLLYKVHYQTNTPASQMLLVFSVLYHFKSNISQIEQLEDLIWGIFTILFPQYC